MTCEKRDYLHQLRELQLNKDTEHAHLLADEVLCSFLVDLGHQDLIDEYHKIVKWYA